MKMVTTNKDVTYSFDVRLASPDEYGYDRLNHIVINIDGQSFLLPDNVASRLMYNLEDILKSI